MRKLLCYLVVALLCGFAAKAQYVTVPDPALQFILLNAYNGCIVGSQLDTSCANARVDVVGLSIGDTSVHNLEGIQYLNKIASLSIYNTSVTSIPGFSLSLKDLFCFENYNLQSLPPFPDSVQMIQFFSSPLVTILPTLPSHLKYLNCQLTNIVSLPTLPSTLLNLNCNSNHISTLPTLPASLQEFQADENKLTLLPTLPAGLQKLQANGNQLTSLPAFPASVQHISVNRNQLISLPAFPDSCLYFSATNNQIISIPSIPSKMDELYLSDNPLNALPTSLHNISRLNVTHTQLVALPAILPNNMTDLVVQYNPISYLPDLPDSLTRLSIYATNIHCLPVLPRHLQTLEFDSYMVLCIPNTTSTLALLDSNGHLFTIYPICNSVNNVNGCLTFPTMQGNIFYDLNSNGIQDAGEYVKRNGKVSLSNGAFSFSNNNGFYQLGADTIGAFTVTPVAPNYFKAVPTNASYNFPTYDTTVTKDFALQPLLSHDSVNVLLDPFSWRARPGFGFSYKVSYQNAGSTNLGATNVVLHYDSAKLTFNNASNAAVINAGNTLILALPSLPVGDFGDFTANFTVKTTAPLGDTLVTDAVMTSGSSTSADTSRTLITGSFDPNDKDAIPYLTPQQVVNGKYIDYTIRFQNTGTDTAIHVVITDTLGSQLQANTLEMVSTSHLCKTTVKGNAISFEMRNIMLPDSNVNEAASHGFIRFRVKPVSTLTLGNTVPNKAAIYFDYNTPVVTNTAITTIKNDGLFPLKLLSFKGNRLLQGNVFLYWQTANEENTKSFDIEQSFTGRNFEKIGEVKAFGNGDHSYAYTSDKVFTGNVYFRLKMKDKDGTFTYAPVVLIKAGDAKRCFVIGANPLNDKLVINAINPSIINTEATLINSVGVVVKRFVLKASTQNVDVSALPAGLYVVHTQMGSEKVMKK